MEVRRLAARKEELYRALLGDRVPMVPPGVTSLLSILKTNKASLLPRPATGLLRLVCCNKQHKLTIC